VIAAWVQPDRRWSPSYQLRVDDKGSALISLTAQGVTLAKGEAVELVLAPLRSVGSSPRFRYENEWSILKKEECKVVNTQDAISAPFTVSLINSSLLNLPSGEISCFKSGVYMGQGSFQGVDAGKSTEIVCSGK